MAKTLYQNKNGTLEPISWMPFVSTTQAELDARPDVYPEGTIVHVTDGEDVTKIGLGSYKTSAVNTTYSAYMYTIGKLAIINRLYLVVNLGNGNTTLFENLPIKARESANLVICRMDGSYLGRCSYSADGSIVVQKNGAENSVTIFISGTFVIA